FNRLDCSVDDSPAGIAKFDLTLDVVQCDEKVVLNWEFDTALFAPATISSLAQSYNRLLQQLLLQPEAQLATLPLAEFVVPAVYTDKQPYHSLLSRIHSYAAVNGDAIALVSGERRVCYAELVQQITSRAAYLRASGVQSGDIVGIWQNRDA